MAERFSFKWNDFDTNTSKALGLLRNEDFLQDVTLVVEDSHQVAAHKLVLSACSDYFKTIFKNYRSAFNRFDTYIKFWKISFSSFFYIIEIG